MGLAREGEPGGKAAEILDAGERMARQGGYDGFSFRDIAKAVGIKAASVHYHFPGKADLGAALAARYVDRFMAALGDPGQGDPDERIERFIAAFRTSLVEDGMMCLCGIFGAEIEKLPESVAAETRRFYAQSIDWLEAVLARKDLTAPRPRLRAQAMRMLSQLEGAMILARTLGETEAFDAVMDGSA